MLRLTPLLLTLMLTACSFSAPSTPEPQPVYTPVSFAALNGWQSDNLIEAKPALDASCARLGAIPPDRSLGADGKMGRAGDWRAFCAALGAAQSSAQLRELMTAQLQPYRVSAGEQANGLFTGYYEAELRGSLTRGGIYQTPLYKRPDDLVMLDLGEFRPELKGQRLAGRVVGGQLKPYADRAAIVAGALANKNLELVWLDDPIDAFFVQVQGSGIVTLDDGKIMRIGYAGQNGHPYVAIGKTLIEQGVLTRENVSMQSIRAWLKANPTQAEQVKSSNPSYVFFEEQSDRGGPMGAANVPLTPLRSLAVDNRYIGYHVPVWLETAAPQLNRLMVAQDTGGAIRGIVRGDVFWGRGQEAEHNAGLMKSAGQYFVLLPKTLARP
jgi:membrane-bound lytic murein transglycosylase A